MPFERTRAARLRQPRLGSIWIWQPAKIKNPPHAGGYALRGHAARNQPDWNILGQQALKSGTNHHTPTPPSDNSNVRCIQVFHGEIGVHRSDQILPELRIWQIYRPSAPTARWQLPVYSATFNLPLTSSRASKLLAVVLRTQKPA
jgi:hypothetical protein